MDGIHRDSSQLNASRITIFNMKNGRVKSVASVQIINHSQFNDFEIENFNLLVSTVVAAPVKADNILLNANKVVPDTLIETVDVRVNQYSILSRFEIGFKIALNAQVNHIVSEPLYRNSREVINQQVTTRMSICVKSMPDETIS
jgi:hypothetical protein